MQIHATQGIARETTVISGQKAAKTTWEKPKIIKIKIITVLGKQSCTLFKYKATNLEISYKNN